VKYLQLISLTMVIAGLALMVGTPILNLSETVTLTGMMLLLAGVIKLVMIYLWRTVAGFSTEPREREQP